MVPHDIVKYGLIPELVGRLPVIVGLESLDEDALVRIIQEPKNSLLKQYRELLAMDHVDLTFEEDAIKEIAALAIKRETGARGLRAIMEEMMLPIMYEIPSRTDVQQVIVTKDAVQKLAKPRMIYKTQDMISGQVPKDA